MNVSEKKQNKDYIQLPLQWVSSQGMVRENTGQDAGDG